ncbi:MAG TPA: thiamine pyrophosphate-dependent enzyme, partial [Syntrophobacter fumaroxidans]|nr:thiamine pyrophosphate-dependent enzyme [Syntrophobacter fumaroxidans]
FVVCNNRSYRILKYNLRHYWKDHNQPTDQAFPEAFDLARPVLRFDMLAEGQGVDAVRVEKPEEIAPALDRAFGDERPFLIDVVLDSGL